MQIKKQVQRDSDFALLLLFYYYYFAELRLKSSALNILGKCATPELMDIYTF